MGQADKPKAVTIDDVARAASVSITTVSHALSGRGKVAEATRRRVEEAARTLGYAPNRLASGLRSRRSGILGFVSDDIATTPFATRVVLGGQEAAAQRDQLLLVVNSTHDAAIEQRQLSALVSAQVDGIVFARMFHRDTTLLPDVLRHIPTVMIDTSDPAGLIPSAVPDEVAIGTLATATLLGAGHTRIAHLTIDQPGRGRDGRIAGYTAEMARAGLDPLVLDTPEPGDAAAGRQAFELLRRRAADTTAVFAFNDQMAMGVYQSALSIGLSIPRDLSVVGVDDFEPVAAALLPGLTTVALPHYDMGRWGVTTLLSMLDGVDVPAGEQRLQTSLVTRESVAAPPS